MLLKNLNNKLNRILKMIFGGYKTIRRTLIGYGFLDRSRCFSKYWVRE
ncbi:MAG: DUF2087 domain-containing protein [Clostridium sp.]|nr:DUF2087 domain-containing protein [Clostridium sp.]MDU5111311.1 DUF2087 domain-containing protein [Clostridium sp.]